MKNGIVIGAVILVIGGFVALFAFAPKAATEPSSFNIPEDQIPEGQTAEDAPEGVIARNTCINHGGISMHIHPVLSIFVDGESEAIPANLGISDTCMRALHTHDTTGKIHVEYPTQYDFVLGDFFANWGEEFYRDGYDMEMTVNGEVSEENEHLVLRDLDQIVLRYTSVVEEEVDEEEEE